MVKKMFTTEVPARSSVFFLSTAALAAGMFACSGKDGPPTELPAVVVTNPAASESVSSNSSSSGEEMRPAFGDDSDVSGEFLWNTPDLPAGIQLKIDDIAVDLDILEGYLLPKWSSYASSQPLETPVAELTSAYFADPEVVFYELARGVVLLHEAEARFPEINAQDFAAYRIRLEGAAGAAKDSLLARYGAAGWATYVERKFRLQLILEEYQKYATPLTEEELNAFYDSEILANLPEPEKREHIDISFRSMEPSLRANLMRGRAVDAQEKWLDGAILGVEVAATLPAGLSHKWTISKLP